jgi:hypothetical protein
MEKHGPGVYSEADGKTLHISEFELCEALGLPYTRENAEMVEAAAKEAIREHYPNTRTETFGIRDVEDGKE